MDITRRGFLKGTGLAAVSATLGVPVPFADHFPAGLIPVAMGQDAGALTIPGKDGVRVMNDRPINAETIVTELDEDFTSNSRHFVRNNGIIPERATTRSLEGWSLTIDGEVNKPLKLSLADLKSRFKRHEAALVIECGGNGRAGYNPPAKGNQWTLGAVGCAKYAGVRLRDVLKAAGVKSSAVYIGYEAEDLHLSRDPSKTAISRGVPIEKAMDEHSMLAWEMNGEPLPALHGFPLRLICPGWPGSTGGKWIKRIWVRDRVHDGAKMTGTAYRMPKHPVAPGEDVAEEDMEIIEEMPVKSIITRPASGLVAKQSDELSLRGHAWSGMGDVKAMHVSIDFGQTWIEAKLKKPVNAYAWQRWNATVRFPRKGYYEVWARATDQQGRMQPMLVPGWNPKGYLNNAMQRIAVKAV